MDGGMIRLWPSRTGRSINDRFCKRRFPESAVPSTAKANVGTSAAHFNVFFGRFKKMGRQILLSDRLSAFALCAGGSECGNVRNASFLSWQARMIFQECNTSPRGTDRVHCDERSKSVQVQRDVTRGASAEGVGQKDGDRVRTRRVAVARPEVGDIRLRS